MLKKTIEYADFDGNAVSEVAYFNLTQQELLEYFHEEEGGMDVFIQKVIDAKDQKTLITLFKDIIDRSYGVRSSDGRRFYKEPEGLRDFKASPAYSALFMELAANYEAATEFVNGIIPSDLKTKVEKQQLMNDIHVKLAGHPRRIED